MLMRVAIIKIFLRFSVERERARQLTGTVEPLNRNYNEIYTKISLKILNVKPSIT